MSILLLDNSKDCLKTEQSSSLLGANGKTIYIPNQSKDSSDSSSRYEISYTNADDSLKNIKKSTSISSVKKINIDDDSSRYSFFPIKYHILESFYQKQKSIFWTAQEIDYIGDRGDWDNLDTDTRDFIKFILLFFAQADGIINENLIENFKKETSCYKEARYFYAAQEFMEVGHNETYSMLIEAFIRDPEEKHKAFNAIKYYPSIKKIADWMFEWMDNSIPLPERVIAFACIEGMLFSSAFAAIYWIKRKNILHGLCKANEFIARDEALHTEFAVALYHVLTDIDRKFEPVSEVRVHEIIKSALKVAEDFTRDALKVELVGMNADDMVDYVKCTADRLSESLGYNKIYKVENPFDWMLVIGLPNKSNFFETTVSEYSHQCKSEFEFDLDTDF
jgi:ribonucleoside-diphosphate reductase subunit M2